MVLISRNVVAGSLLIRRLQLFLLHVSYCPRLGKCCFMLAKTVLLRACENSPESFTLSEDENVVYVAFPSFHRMEYFIAEESGYGEGNIQTGNETFSGCLKGKDEQPARVHQGALKLFLHIMENTDFQAKLQIYMTVKPIIFVGHFLGGSVATLATLWLLGKRLNKSFPFCITFGCPLVGDAGLDEAVGRENWTGNFCHVVSQHDIAPQILLAPFESITVPLNTLLPYWNAIMPEARKDASDYFIQDAYTALLHSLKDLDGVNHGSPYRPFGAYLFCSSNGAACIINCETVSKMFHLTMQSPENSYDGTVQEHIRYGSVLENVVQNSIRGRRIARSNFESSYKMGISLELDAIGLGAQNNAAQIALERAGGIKNRDNTNASQLAIKLSKAQSNMAELEWYKELCEKVGKGYYDSFKENDMRDIEANLRREKLTGFWNEIIEMWQKHELPSDFQSRKKWIYAGNTYSRLVEPLDIACYYRTSQANGCYPSGTYVSDGRPTRHKILQKWFEENENTRSSETRTKLASLTEDSCFWAHVEEALRDLKEGLHQKLEKFENYVTKMIQDRSISSDIFLEESSFITWWQKYEQIQSPEWKLNSPLYKIMETKSWKE